MAIEIITSLNDPDDGGGDGKLRELKDKKKFDAFHAEARKVGEVVVKAFRTEVANPDSEFRHLVNQIHIGFWKEVWPDRTTDCPEPSAEQLIKHIRSSQKLLDIYYAQFISASLEKAELELLQKHLGLAQDTGNNGVHILAMMSTRMIFGLAYKTSFESGFLSNSDLFNQVQAPDGQIYFCRYKDEQLFLPDGDERVNIVEKRSMCLYIALVKELEPIVREFLETDDNAQIFLSLVSPPSIRHASRINNLCRWVIVNNSKNMTTLASLVDAELGES